MSQDPNEDLNNQMLRLKAAIEELNKASIAVINESLASASARAQNLANEAKEHHMTYVSQNDSVVQEFLGNLRGMRQYMADLRTLNISDAVREDLLRQLQDLQDMVHRRLIELARDVAERMTAIGLAIAEASSTKPQTPSK